MKRFLVVTILLTLSVLFFPGSLEAINEYDLYPLNHQQLLAELTAHFAGMDQTTINNIAADKRPGNEDLITLQEQLSELTADCESVSSTSRKARHTKELDENLTKFSALEQTREASEEIKSAVSEYLDRCIRDNQYTKSKESLEKLMTQFKTDNFYKDLVADRQSCTEDSSRSLRRMVRSYERGNKNFQATVGQVTGRYNGMVSSYTELEDENQRRASENSGFGKSSENTISNLNFLTLKIASTNAELNRLQAEMNSVYATFEDSPLSQSSEINNRLENNGYAFSFDNGNNWYLFEQKSSLLDYLKKIKASPNEVEQIKSLADTMDEKRAELKTAVIDKTANSLATDALYSWIEFNNLHIADNSLEQEEILAELIPYKQVAYERSAASAEVTNFKTSLDLAVTHCAEDAFNDYDNLRQEIDRLPEELKLGFEAERLEILSKHEQLLLTGISAPSTDSFDLLLRAGGKLRELLANYTSCQASEPMKIEINSTEKEASVKTGVTEIKAEEIDLFSFNQAVSGVVSKLGAGNIEINQFMTELETELNNRNPDTPTVESETVLTLSRPWSQKTSILEKTYAIYSCQNSAWVRTNESTELVTVTDKCERRDSIEKNIPQNSDTNPVQTLISALNEELTKNNFDFFGKCEQN